MIRSTLHCMLFFIFYLCSHNIVNHSSVSKISKQASSSGHLLPLNYFNINMRLSSPLILAAAISSSATTAFAPFAVTSRPRSATRASSAAVRLDAEAEKGIQMPQVLPTVDLPSTADIPKGIRHPFVLQRVGLFLGGAGTGTVGTMLGKPKSDKTSTIVAKNVFLATQQIATQISNAGDYKFFGNGNHSKNLEYLLKTNPFMAAALTECKSGFELRAFDKEDPDAVDPSASLFRQIVSCLGGANRRVNIRFDSKMRIHEIRAYEVSRHVMIVIARLAICIEHRINIYIFVQ